MPLSFLADVILKARYPTISALANSVKNRGELLAPLGSAFYFGPYRWSAPEAHKVALKGIKMLSRVAYAFSRRRFRQQHVLRGEPRGLRADLLT